MFSFVFVSKGFFLEFLGYGPIRRKKEQKDKETLASTATKHTHHHEVVEEGATATTTSTNIIHDKTRRGEQRQGPEQKSGRQRSRKNIWKTLPIRTCIPSLLRKSGDNTDHHYL